MEWFRVADGVLESSTNRVASTVVPKFLLRINSILVTALTNLCKCIRVLMVPGSPRDVVRRTILDREVTAGFCTAPRQPSFQIDGRSIVSGRE